MFRRIRGFGERRIRRLPALAVEVIGIFMLWGEVEALFREACSRMKTLRTGGLEKIMMEEKPCWTKDVNDFIKNHESRLSGANSLKVLVRFIKSIMLHYSPGRFTPEYYEIFLKSLKPVC